MIDPPAPIGHDDAPGAHPSDETMSVSLPTRHPGRGAPRRKQLEYWLGHFSQFDLLTDLPNRSQFIDRLHGAIARADRSGRLLGVMLLNLDHFKAVNATHGHRIADLALKGTAERLKGCTRASDSIARLGGDEFSVLLEGLDGKDGATIAAQRLLKALCRPLPIAGREVAITLTAGVAFYPPDGDGIDALLHHADLAMSHAKGHRRGGCEFYSPDLVLSHRRDPQRRAMLDQRLAQLTPREREVLDILVAGNANKMIAYMLGTSTRTIENHRARIMAKMKARSLPELVRMVLDVHDVVPNAVPNAVPDATRP